MTNYMANGKGIIIVLIVGLIKKTLNEILLMTFINESFECNLLNKSLNAIFFNEIEIL